MHPWSTDATHREGFHEMSYNPNLHMAGDKICPRNGGLVSHSGLHAPLCWWLDRPYLLLADFILKAILKY